MQRGSGSTCSRLETRSDGHNGRAKPTRPLSGPSSGKRLPPSSARGRLARRHWPWRSVRQGRRCTSIWSRGATVRSSTSRRCFRRNAKTAGDPRRDSPHTGVVPGVARHDTVVGSRRPAGQLSGGFGCPAVSLLAPHSGGNVGEALDHVGSHRLHRSAGGPAGGAELEPYNELAGPP